MNKFNMTRVIVGCTLLPLSFACSIASAHCVDYQNASLNIQFDQQLVDSNPNNVYEKVSIVPGGDTAFTESFEIGETGTYLAQLTDFVFPNAFTELAMMVSTSTEVLGTTSNPGTTGSFEFDATPGNYFVTLATDAFGEFGDLPATYGIKISWLDSNTQPPVSAVPVPAAAWLFGSGLIGLVGAARRKG